MCQKGAILAKFASESWPNSVDAVKKGASTDKNLVSKVLARSDSGYFCQSWSDSLTEFGRVWPTLSKSTSTHNYLWFKFHCQVPITFPLKLLAHTSSYLEQNAIFGNVGRIRFLRMAEFRQKSEKGTSRHHSLWFESINFKSSCQYKLMFRKKMLFLAILAQFATGSWLNMAETVKRQIPTPILKIWAYNQVSLTSCSKVLTR